MTAPAPESPPSSSSENPVDRALGLLISGQAEPALRWAAALVRADPSGPAGLLLTGRALSQLGHSGPALDAHRAAAERAVEAGSLPLAVAACRYATELGHDPRAELDEIAKTFARGSDRLLVHGSPPPQLPGAAPGFRPLDNALGGEALAEEARELLREAAQWATEQRPRRGQRPQVAPQPLFSSLDVTGLRAMLSIFDVLAVPRGHVLVQEGTPGLQAYVLARGELEVRRSASDGSHEAVVLARLGAGALFGEMALLSRAPRAASVIACRPSIVLVAHKDALDRVAAEQPQLGTEVAAHCRQRMVENLVRTSAILRAVKPSERAALVERFVTRAFEEGDRIIAQGKESEGLHLIASGEVEVVHRGEDDHTVIARLGAGEVVGEVALVLRRPATADVLAALPTVTLHLHRDRFLELVRSYPSVLSELYELAVKREAETIGIVAQEALDADEPIFL